jgi:hypothetical protein
MVYFPLLSELRFKLNKQWLYDILYLNFRGTTAYRYYTKFLLEAAHISDMSRELQG